MQINAKAAIYDKTAQNRVVIQPMEGCDGTQTGGIGELTRRRYRRFAESGAGIIWFEAVAVCEEGRANPRQLWLTEENVAEYRDLLAEIRQISLTRFGYAPLIILQATHSGRYSKPYGAPEPIIACRNSLYEQGKENLPYHIITDGECERIPEMYAKTARLAAQAGFDGVDVKCCHGYLFNEFLSAYSRPGKYGGSFENRTALYFACVDSVRANIDPGMFVTTRLNAYDGFPYPYGFGVSSGRQIDLTETKKMLTILQEKGVELVNITIGNPYLIPEVNRPSIGGSEDGMAGVQRVADITDELQKSFPALKLVLSALTFPGTDAIDFAEKCLQSGSCTFVGFGRMAFAYPQFYADYLKNGCLDPKKVCIKCGNCSKMMRSGGVAGCPVRDREVYLPLYRQYVGGENR